MMRKALYVVGTLLVLFVLIIVFFRPSSSEIEGEEVPISVMLAGLRAGTVSEIRVRGDDLTITLHDGSEFVTKKEAGTSLFTILADNSINSGGVQIEIEDNSTELGGWAALLLNFVPLLIFGGIVYALVLAVRRFPKP
jgi:ATP-dependent Zn protease